MNGILSNWIELVSVISRQEIMIEQTTNYVNIRDYDGEVLLRVFDFMGSMQQTCSVKALFSDYLRYLWFKRN